MDIEEFAMGGLPEQEGSVFPARHLMQTVTLTVSVTVGRHVPGVAHPGIRRIEMSRLGKPGVPGLPV